MHVAEGFLAVATRAADPAERDETNDETPRVSSSSTISAYRLDVGGLTGGPAGPAVTFRASVDVPGAVAAVSLCDGALWSLSTEGVVRGWSLDDLAAGEAAPGAGPAAFGLDDAADALAAWDARDPRGARARRSPCSGATLKGTRSGARAVDVAADLTNEIAARARRTPRRCATRSPR